MSNVEIPVNQPDRGLGLCAENIRRFIEDVDLLLEHSSTLHATALSIFTAEELAKYSELRKAKQSATGQTASVDARLFRSHQHKQELARALIPKDALILSPAAFDAEAFDSRDFQTEDVEVSPALRLDCVFVDWQDGRWAYGSTVKVDRLKQFTQAIGLP